VRAGHPVAVVVCGMVLGLLAHPVRLAAQPLVDGGELEVYDAIPADPAFRMAVGEARQFSIWVKGEGLHYQWLLDGGPVGDRHSWTFVARPTDVGLHLVSVVVEGPEGRTSRSWRVEVEPEDTSARPSTTAPARPAVTSTVAALPAATSTSSTSSTSTTAAPTTSSTSSTSTTRLEPTTSSSSSSTTTRPPTTSSTRVPTTTTRRRPPTTVATTTTTLRTTSTAPPITTTTIAARPTTTVPSGAITESEVRALFDRYEAAWRNQDIAALEAVGQVATQGQADALKAYFESVRDLQVEVTILGITLAGDEARVRFIRRDRFRDPGGTMVKKESPVIEKRIVRTPGGLRLAPLR
jgi:hypothetical protein